MHYGCMSSQILQLATLIILFALIRIWCYSYISSSNCKLNCVNEVDIVVWILYSTSVPGKMPYSPTISPSFLDSCPTNAAQLPVSSAFHSPRLFPNVNSGSRFPYCLDRVSGVIVTAF